MASGSPKPPDLNERGDSPSKSHAPVFKEILDCGGQDTLGAPVGAQVTSVGPKADVQDDSFIRTAVVRNSPEKSETVVDTSADGSPHDVDGIRHLGGAGIAQLVDGVLMDGSVGGSFVAENVEMNTSNTEKGLMSDQEMPSSSSNPAAQVPEPRLSPEEFREILQMSQWSLTYRIYACTLLRDRRFRVSLGPRSRKKYAKQSLSLIKMNLQSDGNTLFASILGDLEASEYSEDSEDLQHLEDWGDETDPKQISQAWEKLASELEKEQDTLREKDTHKNWYKAFEGKAFKPHEIFEAVELNFFSLAQRMMDQVTRSLLEIQDCTGITPGEYRGATPLHWAMLRGNRAMVGLMIEEANKLEDAFKATLANQDEFGFKPIHMAILSSFMNECFPEWDRTNLNSLLHSNSNEHAYIVRSVQPYLFGKGVKGVTMTFSRIIFGANKVLSPIELAIYIAKEKVVENLMVRFVGFVKPCNGDTLLHFAARGLNRDYKTIMNLVLRHLHLHPSMLNSCNNDGETPLHIAILQRKPALVFALLRCHYVKVDNGRIPLQFVEDEDASIRNLIENHPQGQRHMQLLQLSQWSLRHRILAIHMFIENENDAKLEMIRDIYMKQCRLVAGGDSSRRGDVAELIDITNKLRRKHKELSESHGYHQELREVFISIEEGDYPMNMLNHFQQNETRNKLDRLLDRYSDGYALDPVPSSLPEYTGANWFHWAVLHGRADMVDSICSKVKDNILYKKHVPSSRYDDDKTQNSEIQDGLKPEWSQFNRQWAEIVDARDGFGFTPLHLVAFPFPWLSNQTYTVDDGTHNNVKLVEKLWENKFPHCASRGPRSNFMLWICSDDGGTHADDNFPTSSDVYPLQLAIHTAHPRIVEKFLEKCSEETFVKTHSSDDTILHRAKEWNALINRSGDHWRRIETILLKLLDSPSNSEAVNVLNKDGDTPLHKAVRSMCQEWVNVLLQCAHIKCNLRDNSSGNTILHDAEAWEALSKSSGDQWRRIETNLLKLLDSPLNSEAMNVCNNDTDTPLHKAVRSKSQEWVNVLLQCEHIKCNLRDNSSGNTILHDAEAWEALSKSSGDQWRRIETNLLKLLHSPSNSEVVNVCNNDRDTPLHKAVRSKSQEWVNVLLQCEKIKCNLRDSSSGNTILHDAEAWEALSKSSGDQWRRIETNLLKLLDSPLNSTAVNVRSNDRDTPLHKAVRSKSQKWVNVLLQCEHIKFNLRDKESCTPEEVALRELKELTNKETVTLFQCILRWSQSNKTSSDRESTPMPSIIQSIRSFDPESKPQERETLQRERQVYVDAANAILVGAALIASASFGAWLQPPLGYQAYYSPEFQDTSPAAPPETYESYVAIKQHWILQMFWIFNSLAFFFSLATVIAGADAAIPWQKTELKKAVDSVRQAVKIASALLGVAIVFVICTFATLGFAILPPIKKYRINMWCTLAVGVVVCSVVLIRLLWKLVLSGSQTTGSAKPTQTAQITELS